MPDYPWRERNDALPEQIRDALAGGLRFTVLDVRTAPEYAAYHIPGAVSAPMDTLASSLEDLDREETYVVVCEHGVRSKACTGWLTQQGLKVVNMVGGMASYPGPTEQGPPR